VTPFNERDATSGARFSYASAQTLLGLVLARATGRRVAEYLEHKISQPIGAESDATWLVDNSGQEATFAGLNAVLREYARLGRLLAHDGNWRGRQVLESGALWFGLVRQLGSR
jgi:CubicO group peptidase (beta-lactamase class C family)